jgi:ribosome-associated protein
MTSDLPPQPLTPPSGVELAPRLRVPESAVRFKFVRARGPGGQNVNKVSSACELRIWLADLAPQLRETALDRLKAALGSRLTAAGEIILTSDERRTQEQNREAVLMRLRDILVTAMVEPRRRKKTKPSRASKQRRLTAKKARGAIKSQRQSRGDD